VYAAVVSTFGQVPEYAEVPDPSPTGSTVTGRVLAASLKNLDRGLVAGSHYASGALTLPFVPGVDGVVELDDGRRVYSPAVAPHGMMAERTVVDPADMVVLPDGLDPVLAAALPNAGLSAWYSLEYAGQVRPGHNVLILGATGVTGALAAQLAHGRFGAGRLVVAGRNRERLQMLHETCGAHVLQLDGGDLTEQVAALHADAPFDAVIDYLWGAPAEQTLTAVSGAHGSGGFHRTRYVQVGAMTGATITLPAAVLRSAGIEVVGVGIGSVPGDLQARANTEILPALFAMAAAGDLDIAVSTWPLRDVAEAWTAPVPSGTRAVLVT